VADLKGAQAACVFGSGYLANAGIIPTFVGSGGLVLIDTLAKARRFTRALGLSEAQGAVVPVILGGAHEALAAAAAGGLLRRIPGRGRRPPGAGGESCGAIG
jgi:hypothetical protein